MFGLDSSDGYDNRRCYYVYYRLLDRRVYDLRVSGDFLKISNCFKELVYVCELGGVIKIKKKRILLLLFFT